MQVGLLGPLQLEVDGTAVHLGSAKERALLSLLALRAGNIVSVADLVSALWGEDPPMKARKTLQTHLANLRKSLPPHAIRTAGPGYSLAIPDDAVDARRFERLLALARETDNSRDSAETVRLLSEAVDLWRGEALWDLRDHHLGLAEATRLEELRRAAEEDVMEMRLTGGVDSTLVSDLEAAVATAPLRERRWRLLMLALYRSGRQAEALRAYRRLWEQLDRDVGLRPSAKSTELERAILDQRPELDLPLTADAGTPEFSPSSGVTHGSWTSASDETTLLVCGIDELRDFPEESAERWYQSLTEYHSLVVEESDRFGGRVIAALGEMVYVHFGAAGDALRCAVSLLHDVRARDGPRTDTRLPRIAIHTASFDWQDGDTQGPEVKVVVGLHSSAHSGQVLLTDAAARACRPGFQDQTDLEELGAFVLPGSRELTTVYSLALTRGSSDFPPLRLAQLGRDEVPSERKGLVGRDTLVSEVLSLVRDAPLVTLWGPGGIGKTSVAVRLAGLASGPFDDGIRFVDLSVITEAGAVAEIILSRLHGTAADGEAPPEAVLRTLRTARLLLVLDSCEHVLPQSRELASSIIAGCPWVRILATSREPLGLEIEQRIEVPPLPVPAPSVRELHEISSSPAVRLFCERAQFVDRSFRITEENATAVVEVCRRLGGSPLALELAAGRLDVETVGELARGEDNAPLLPRLTREARSGQRPMTVLDSLKGSHSLLSSLEQDVFAALGVFAGTFTREMARDLMAPVPSTDVDRAFDRLVRASMIARDSSGSDRFRLFEPTAEFARSLLDRTRLDALAVRHAEIMFDRAEYFAPLIHTDQEVRASNVLAADFANHRRALEWRFEHGDVDLAARHAAALFQFCHFQLLPEGYEWVNRALAHLGHESELTTEICGAAALGAWFAGDTERAIELGNRAVRALPYSRDAHAFWARLALVDTLAYQERHEELAVHFQALVDASRSTDDRFWKINGLGYEVFGQLMFGRHEKAMERAERAVALAKELNNPDCTQFALLCLGRVLALSDPEAASEAFSGATAAARLAGSRWNLALDLLDWAAVQCRLDDLLGAALGLLEAIELLGATGNRSQLASLLLESARVLAQHGEAEVAFILVEARLGLPEMPSRLRQEVADHELAARLREAVGPAASRLGTRARALPYHDLIVMCRASLEEVVRLGASGNAQWMQRLPDVAVVFTDLVASTELNVRLGDDRFAVLMEEHSALLNRRLERFGGRQFADTGDGVGVVFDDVDEAVRFAVGLQDDLDDANADHPDAVLRVRVGVARGEVLEDQGGHLHGQTVVRAARVCSAAAGAQALAGEDVTAAVGPDVASFETVGTFALKGFGISVPLFAATRPEEVVELARQV